MSAEELHRRFLECSGACTDTRQLLDNGMFFALKGPTFNANAFAAEALAQGCRYAVVDDPAVADGARYVVVPDVLQALQDLGGHHRRQFRIPVVAITGTNGKTTTKELLHAVLGAKAPTLATAGNLNNHIGVPLTLLEMNSRHRFAIIEMGANHIGEIAALCAIAAPTHGLVTNIGKAHLEGFGSFEGVVEAKTELYDWLARSKGTAFVNAGDVLLMDKSARVDRITYGTVDHGAVRGEAVHKGPFLSFWFGGTNGERHDVVTRLIGDYNLPNALAAVCIGQYFDVPDLAIVGALAGYAPSNNRSQFIDTGRNHVVMDAYNANPTSMRAALMNFAALDEKRPKLAILGDMLELGGASMEEHASIVALLLSLKLNGWLIGPEFSKAALNNTFLRYEHVSDALAFAQRSALNGQMILVKGSRGIKLESLLPAL